MKNKWLFLKIFLVMLLAGLCGYGLVAGGRAAAPKMLPGQLELIGRLASKALANNHLRKLPQDAVLSSRVFDEYFDQIDPGKFYFTQMDIAVFEKDRFRLLEELNNGEQKVIYAIYERYLERLGEYRTFIDAEIKKGIRFDIDENYRIHRKDAKYCCDDNELRELWRKRLKNDLLGQRLMQKVMEERSNDPAVREEMKKRWFKKSPEDKVRARMHDLYNYAVQQEKIDILGIFLTAMAQVYGPHSHYSTPKQEEDFDIQFKLSLSGIGATLTSEDGYTKIVDIVPGGPADRDGRLKAEDRIIAVAQEGEEAIDIIDMSVTNAVKLIRGPAGSKVTLTILPAAKGPAALPEDITIVRGKVELKENAAAGEIKEVVTPDNVKKQIGVIRFNNFYMDFDGAAKGLPDYRSCSRDVRQILTGFNKSKVDAVVLDLRGNSGGSLLEAVRMSGLFIKQGPVVQVVDALHRLDVQRDSDPAIAYSGPVVVLVSKFSASSAEILTGALKDYRRAIIVGDSRTYGKGTVLSVTDLGRLLRFVYRKLEAGSLTNEMAMFYRINGESNQATGVPSDIVLPSFSEVLEVGEVYSDNHLPWNKIKSVEVDASAVDGCVQLSDEIRKKLIARSLRRIRNAQEWARFRDDIARFNSIQKRRVVSLNEKTRLKEYYDEKAAADRIEALADDSSDSKNKKKNQKDLILLEALNIAADFDHYTRDSSINGRK